MTNKNWKNNLTEEDKKKLAETEAYLHSFNISKEDVENYQMNEEEKEAIKFDEEFFESPENDSEPDVAICIKVNDKFLYYSADGVCLRMH